MKKTCFFQEGLYFYSITNGRSSAPTLDVPKLGRDCGINYQPQLVLAGLYRYQSTVQHRPFTTSFCRRRRHDCNMNLSGKLIPPESAYDKIEEGQPVAEELSMFIPAPVFTSITSKHVFPLGCSRWVEIPPICVLVSRPCIVDGWSTT